MLLTAFEKYIANQIQNKTLSLNFNREMRIHFTVGYKDSQFVSRDMKNYINYGYIFYFNRNSLFFII